MNLDPEDYSDQSADLRISKAFGIVGREDITANLFECRPPAAATVARSGSTPATPSPGPAADGRTSSRSTAGCGYWRGTHRDDGYDCRTFARVGGSWRASQGRRSGLGSILLLSFRLGCDSFRDLLSWRLRLWRLQQCDLDQLLGRCLHSTRAHVETRRKSQAKAQRNDSRRGQRSVTLPRRNSLKAAGHRRPSRG